MTRLVEGEATGRVSTPDVSFTAAGEFRANWKLIAGSLLGSSFISFPFYITSIFMMPWQSEFGWRRSQIALAMSCYTICLVVASPIVGRIVDRVGAMVPVLCSLVLLGFGFGAVAMVNSHIWSLYLAYAAIAVFGAATTPVTFARLVSSAFDRGRGLALGIAVTGTSVTGLFAPVLAHKLIESLGWRDTWLWFAALPLLSAPIVFASVRTAARIERAHRQATRRTERAAAEPGATVLEAMRSAQFWTMGLAFFLTTTAIVGTVGQIVPVLRRIGISTGEAVLMQSVMTVGLILGRVACGYVVDRVFAPVVYQVMCLASAIGFLMLASGYAFLALPALVFIGAALGAEFDLVAYLVSKYYGLKNYSQIYGYLYALTLTGGIIAPVIVGFSYDIYKQYTNILLSSAVMLITAALLLRRLGPFPVFRVEAP